ncbi:MAG: hypothetical protein H7124_04715 [Phycisphaerales bacterium]|nr:hypothetical protein [Hyphomonadaceae bacterium]
MRMLLILAALAFAPAAHAQTLSDLAWLKGCWRTQGAETEITEVWLAPPMPALLGYSYTTRDGEVRGWEQTRIELIDDVPHFIAMPNGSGPVRFRSVDTTDVIHTGGQPDGFALFENPEHDYPQRVMYMRLGNRLIAQISGAGGTDRVTFEYRRISCGVALRP